MKRSTILSITIACLVIFSFSCATPGPGVTDNTRPPETRGLPPQPGTTNPAPNKPAPPKDTTKKENPNIPKPIEDLTKN